MGEANRSGEGSEFFSVQISRKLRKDFSGFCDTCGYSVTDAIMMLALQTMRQEKIPFAAGDSGAVSMYSDALRVGSKEEKATRLVVRMARQMQDDFSAACEKFGINRSMLVRMFFQRCVDEKRLVIETDASDFPHGEDFPKTDFNYLSIQIAPDVRNDFMALCNASEHTVADATEAFIRRVIKQKAIPFDVKALPRYTICASANGGEPVKGKKSVRMLVKMDADQQKEFAVMCDAIGITKSVLLRMYYMRCVNDEKLMFI